MLFDALQLETPIAGFNGGLFVKRDLSIIEQKTLPPDVAAKAIELIRGHGLDAWVYRGNDWLITKPDAPARGARGLDGQIRAEGGGGFHECAGRRGEDRRYQR